MTDPVQAWTALSREQQEVLVCAYEVSGYLTGAFGIWADPPPDVSPDRTRGWVAEQIAPLVAFVAEGWIEVRHLPEPGSDAYTVVALDDLIDAFCDPDTRYQGHEWGVGLTCVFTDRGADVWYAAWSRAWHERLRFD